jgi:hypothetical protein
MTARKKVARSWAKPSVLLVGAVRLLNEVVADTDRHVMLLAERLDAPQDIDQLSCVRQLVAGKSEEEFVQILVVGAG